MRDVATDCKGGSCDGWEPLFLLSMCFAASRTADVNCVPNISFDTTKVSTLLYYNYPFSSQMSIAKIENVEQLQLALDKIQDNYVWVGDFPKVST